AGKEPHIGVVAVAGRAIGRDRDGLAGVEVGSGGGEGGGSKCDENGRSTEFTHRVSPTAALHELVRSHSFIILSWPPDNALRPLGEIATASTFSSCSKVCNTLPVVTSHCLTVPSQLPDSV